VIGEQPKLILKGTKEAAAEAEAIAAEPKPWPQKTFRKPSAWQPN
jgi:hypothetical protein